MGGRVIRRKIVNTDSINDVFNAFKTSKKAIGTSIKTLQSYEYHIKAFFKFCDPSLSINQITYSDIESWIAKLRTENVKDTTIASYVRSLKSFFSWAKQRDYTDLVIRIYKAEAPPKEIYSDEELIKLTTRPTRKDCSFPEFRNYVMVCFFLSTGCRAGTIRSIQCGDIDFDNNLVYFRHMKSANSKKGNSIHSVPLSTTTKHLLLEYLKYRNGNQDEWLFCTEKNGQFSERGLQQAIKDYNLSKGVTRSSIHAFRHTFAKKFLLDCGGNAFTLQKILGHSTLDMTLQYCTIFNADLQKNFDIFNPLEFMVKRQPKKISIKD